jgi:hypothetical protein
MRNVERDIRKLMCCNLPSCELVREERLVNQKQGGAFFSTPPWSSLKDRFLETELRSKLESPWTAGAEHAGGAGGWSVDHIPNYVRAFTLV